MISHMVLGDLILDPFGGLGIHQRGTHNDMPQPLRLHNLNPW